MGPGTSASSVIYFVSSLRLKLVEASPALIMSRGFHTGDPTNKETKTGQIKQKSIYEFASEFSSGHATAMDTVQARERDAISSWLKRV